MEIKDLIKQISENYHEAELDTLEIWTGQLSIEFAFLATNIGECKKTRAIREIEIKKRLEEKGVKPTEKAIEREYDASEEGQFLSLNEMYLKAIGKLISACRFRAEALRGKI